MPSAIEKSRDEEQKFFEVTQAAKPGLKVTQGTPQSMLGEPEEYSFPPDLPAEKSDLSL